MDSQLFPVLGTSAAWTFCSGDHVPVVESHARLKGHCGPQGSEKTSQIMKMLLNTFDYEWYHPALL
ncbi:hypothetical protein I79_008732 [Cricetulus griseus]|uniref:Uncharacterized protein n=1 Tax=Cricetulus griseus TaxID=10029 RepID=G3HDW5_CRIGR|nr:hypothetical protein I79_008732 [Cricetulus griseus]